MKKAAGGRFLAFDIDGSEYAVEVERVEVVLETMPITRVPKASRHLKGVINYRGSVIPVADLRARFDLSGTDPRPSAAPVVEAASKVSGTEVAVSVPAQVPASAQEGGVAATMSSGVAATMSSGVAATMSSGESIVVLHVRYAGDDIVMGILADSVREVLDIDSAHIAEAPSLGGRDDLVSGIGEKDGRFIVLLDIEEAFNLEGLAAASVAPAEAR